MFQRGADQRLKNGQDQKMLTSARSQSASSIKTGPANTTYRVAVNDLNRPSLIMLMSLLVPAFLACSLAFYLVTMPLDSAKPVAGRTALTGTTINDTRTGVFPDALTPVRDYGIIRTGAYIVYVPVVMNQGGTGNENLP
jgi:hypothetical protein